MKEEKRHKRGDVREDGMVFWGYNKKCKNGEYWMTAEKFAEYHEKHNARNHERYCERRKDPEWRERRNARVREWQREQMEDSEYREKRNALNRERRKDPEYREKEKAQKRERYREQMEDSEWREKQNSLCRKWQRERRKDPEYREKINERKRERMKDPEFREKRNARDRERHRERYANDPEYRAMIEVRSLVKRVEKGGKRSLEIYGVPTKELATKIRRGRLRIYNKYFKGIEKHLDHIFPLAEVKHSIEEMHKRSHFTNLVYIPAKENLSKHATPFWEWFAGLTDEKLKRCIAEQDAYNKKIQNQLNANA